MRVIMATTTTADKIGGGQANWPDKAVYTADNLPIMLGMNSACVDLIYLDPPFNSNKSFSAPIGSKAAGASFDDAWTLKQVDITEWYLLGEKHEVLGAKLKSVLKAARFTHGDSMFSYLLFMSNRLIECHRILKDTGSLYLHCDSHASHYLKLILDCIFGKASFRNEITWKRKTSPGSEKSIVNAHDTIYYYTKTTKFTFNQQYLPYSQEYIDEWFKHEDSHGKYMSQNIVATPSLQGGGSHYTYNGYTPDRGWLVNKGKLTEMDKDGRILWPKKPGGVPRRKQYLHEGLGVQLYSIWTDIKHAQGRERTGYRTQKPLALLERIIKASSNEGDLVFDPFCGCATTMVVANRLNRNWIGIDISSKAVELVIDRIRDDGGLFAEISHETKIPVRTDLGPELTEPQKKAHKKELFIAQNLKCNNPHCFYDVAVRDIDHALSNVDLDRIVPPKLGGGYYKGNLQVLCRGCNTKKSDRKWEDFLAEYEKIKQVLI